MKLSILATCLARIPPRKIQIALPVMVMVALWKLSSIPGIQRPDTPALYSLFYWISPALQNTMHVPAFAALTCAWRWALCSWLRGSKMRSASAFAITSAYGAFDEWHQSFIPGRYASLVDILLDLVGALLGIWLAVWFSRSEGVV